MRQKNGYNSILRRFQDSEICQNSQTGIGWTEDFCKRLEELAGAHQAYVATRQERERHEKVWALSVNSQGPAAPILSRTDIPAALRTFREM